MGLSYFSIILKDDDTLWGCGGNGSGELGLGNSANKTTFTQITTNTDDVKEIYCGGGHTFILKNDDTLWGCGYNRDYGQLGLGDNIDRNTFTQITDDDIDNIKSVYCGGDHTLILKNDGTLWSCGKNSYGQIGRASCRERV